MALQLLTQSYQVSIKFTGLRGELRVDSTNWNLVLDDGVTPGGIRFLSVNNADERYQARSQELDGLLGFEPQNKGYLIRRGPESYRIRKFEVNADNLAVANANGYDGNTKFELAAIVKSNHNWQGKQTFTELIGAEGGLEGDVKGNVVGNVLGNLTGDSAGKHTGSIDATNGTVELPSDSIKLEDLEFKIRDLLMPVGAILLWSGAVSAIPQGWKLCNGTNDTPDLRDRFIMGAGGDQNPGDTGGNELLENPVSIAESGLHTHGVAGNVGSALTGIVVTPASSGKVDAGGSAKNVARAPFSTNDPGHTHDFEGALTTESGTHTHALTVEQEHLLPPFFALCYIMKAA